MGDIAWVRKYRPSSFDDYMGEDIKRLVVNRFKDKNSIPNTIFLFGTRGTGKTSMARLLCKEIHCMTPVNGQSCGHCDMCTEIDEYISSTEAGIECSGITEVDAATTTGKSDISDIIEDALVPPMYPLKHKVLILDECHMLSTSAQNSLLKVIEEPPKHLIFILCTTDPDKVIGTIRSRMQLKLEVKKKTVEEMVVKLSDIAQKENLTISKEALQIIAKKGERVPRECIMLLETVAKNYGNNVTIQSVRESLGDIATEIYIEFFNAANKSLPSIINFNIALKNKDISAKQFMSGLTRFVLDSIYVKSGINLDDFPVEFLKQAKDLFGMYNTSELDTMLQIIESAIMRIDDDDTKSELIITNLALRIGKVKMLAQGLQSEGDSASQENKESVRKYSKILADKGEEALHKIPDVSIARETFASFFPHMTEVSGGKESVNLGAEGTPPEDDGEDAETKKLLDLFNKSDL